MKWSEFTELFEQARIESFINHRLDLSNYFSLLQVEERLGATLVANAAAKESVEPNYDHLIKINHENTLKGIHEKIRKTDLQMRIIDETIKSYIDEKHDEEPKQQKLPLRDRNATADVSKQDVPVQPKNKTKDIQDGSKGVSSGNGSGNKEVS